LEGAVLDRPNGLERPALPILFLMSTLCTGHTDKTWI
jgi:hypothetical protein